MPIKSKPPSAHKGDTEPGSSPSVSASTKLELLPRIWPPLMDQAYCVDHFLDECEAYHRYEKARFEKLRVSIIDTYPAAEKSLRGTISSRTGTRDAATGKATDGVLGGEAVSASAAAEIAKLREQRKKLGLHRSLRTFLGHIGETIRQCSHELSLGKAQADPGSPLQNAHKDKCPFLPRRGKNLMCRYCDFENIKLRPVAPVAPMHQISKTSFMKRQCKSIYGVVFAVDVCSQQVVVTLHEMAWLDDLDSLAQGGETIKDGGEGLTKIRPAKISSEKLAETRTQQDSSMKRREILARQGDRSDSDGRAAPRNREATKPPHDDGGSVEHKRLKKPDRSATTSSRQSTSGSGRLVPSVGKTKIIRKQEDDDDDDVVIRKRRKLPSRIG